MGLYKRLFKKKQQHASTGTTDNHGLVETPRPGQAASGAEHSERPSEISPPPSLWRDAANQLQPKEQAKLNALLKSKQVAKNCQDLDPSMADIDLVISRTKDLEEGNRLTTCRPILAKITKAAIAIKKIGDTAADLDKSGYAAIGWSVVSAGLQVAVNAEMARQFVLASSEFTTALLTRYAKYEAELRGPHAGEEFDNRIVNVYKAILLYVIALDTFLGRCAAGRIGHAFGKIEDRTISQRKTEVAEADDLVKEWLPIIQHVSQKHEFSKLHQRPDIGPSPTLLATQGCSKSLAFEKMDDRFGGIDTASDGTCSWLFQHSVYKEWATSKCGLLWIRGKPGSGKSTLLRFALGRSLAESASKPNNDNSNIHPSPLVLYFFFHGRGIELQKSLVGLFRTVLHQLLKQAPESLQELLKTYEDRCQNTGKPGKNWQWQLQELQEFLHSALRYVLRSRPVRLFVDALDEGGRDNAVKAVAWFKSFLKGLSHADANIGSLPCHICFTCRHYPILSLDGGFEICVEHENGHDISTYVHDRLSESQIPPDLIIQRANGVFLWCRLTLDKILLLEMDVDGGIEEMVESTPPGLEDLYLTLISNMEKKAISLRLMQWVCFSARPLTLDEMRWAIVVHARCSHRSLEQCERDRDYTPDSETMKRKLRRLGCGLVETIQSTEDGNPVEIVQFIHQSIKEFFVKIGLRVLMDDNTTLDADIASRSIPMDTDLNVVSAAHYQLSRSCLRYLGMEEFSEENMLFYGERYRLVRAFPLVQYAATLWAVHARETEESEQVDIVGYFSWPTNAMVEDWIKICEVLDRYSEDLLPRNSSLLHAAIHCRLTGLLQALVRKAPSFGVNIDLRDSNHDSPLLVAAETGQETAVRLLLDTGEVDVNMQGRNEYTPLSWAASKGHVSIAKLLIGMEEIDIHLGDIIGCSPLALAAIEGSKAIVQALLDSGAEIDSKDNDGDTPLRSAAEYGNTEVVELLLETGKVDVKIKDSNGWTPLIWAARNGHEAVVRLLLKTGGADTEHRDIYGRTALSWTAEYGHEAVIWMLLGMGRADINTKDDEGATPLSWAAKEGRDAVVRALLRNEKIDIDSRDCEGRTALFLAARAGSETIVRQLLKTGKVDVDATDKQGDTPLSVAVEKGHLNVAQLLRPFAEASRPPMEENDSIATAEDDSSTVVGESPTTDASSMMMAGDSFASVKDRFATVDASFAAVKNASLSTAKGKNTIAVSSVEVRPLAT